MTTSVRHVNIIEDVGQHKPEPKKIQDDRYKKNPKIKINNIEYHVIPNRESLTKSHKPRKESPYKTRGGKTSHGGRKSRGGRKTRRTRRKRRTRSKNIRRVKRKNI